MQRVAAPPHAVPGNSGRRRRRWRKARQRWLTSPHSAGRHLDRSVWDAVLARPGSDRGPAGSREAGHRLGCRSEWNLVRHTPHSCGDKSEGELVEMRGERGHKNRS